jgi:hypothetical protein
MIDDWLLSLIYAAWLAGSTMPLGLMLGSSCSPCCPQACGVADGKPRTDPANEGTWVPSGTWRGVGGVTWAFTANPGDDSGETWFFYGSASTSRVGGGATTAERRDWGNICNWYSNKTTSPSVTSGLPGAFNKRATRLPPNDAVVHIYSAVETAATGPATVKNAYFWGGTSGSLWEITATQAAHDSAGGCVFNGTTQNTLNSVINGGATFDDRSRNFAVVNGGATFNSLAINNATVNGGATFNDTSLNASGSTVNGGATFNQSSLNYDADVIVNDGATFNDTSINFATVNGGATFNDSSINSLTVNGGATFNSLAANNATVNGGATFNDTSINGTTVNGGATFNDSSNNGPTATVNSGATFNDNACSQRAVGNFFAIPCTRKFVAHPTDLPTCSGTAPNGCNNFADNCGCG